MAQYSEATTEYIVNRVKEQLVVNPNISLRGLKEQLEKPDQDGRTLPLSVPYLAKLRDKIIRSRAFVYKNADILVRLGEMHQTKREVIKRLWQEAEYASKSKERATALKAIMDIERDMLQSEMDAGLYERKLGTLELEQRRLKLQDIIQTLDPNDREKILNQLDAHLHAGGGAIHALPLPTADAHRAGDIPLQSESDEKPVEAGETTLGVESPTD